MSEADFRRWRRKQRWVSDVNEAGMPTAVRKKHQRAHQHQQWDRVLLGRATTKARKRALRRRIKRHQVVIDRIHLQYAAGAVPSTPQGPPGPSDPQGPVPPVDVFPEQPTAPEATHDFFQHGVATGDPLPDRVVIWTRVTPTPDAAPGSGLGPEGQVRWQVAEDPGFTAIVAEGVADTDAGRDHTVKLDATGLEPATAYHVRFAYQGPWRAWQLSPTARTRTAPAADSLPENLRLGIVSCANLQAGWFTPYRALAARDDLHAILHLGDYVYEYGVGEYGYGAANTDIRPHDPPHEMVSLEDYRRRHAQYKQDPDLARLHRRHPFIITWDDHETADNAWVDGAGNHQPDAEGQWRRRYADAKQAYDEWMPIRLRDDERTLYRRLRFGNLAELTMLDLRSYRNEQAALGSPDSDKPGRTIAGAEQMAFLKESLTPDAPQWRLVGNPVMIAPVRVGPSLPQGAADALSRLGGGTVAAPAGFPYNTDQWDGYTADRRELFSHIADQGVRDVVFLTGDIHSAWTCELPYDTSLYALRLTDAYRLGGGSAGVEFVTTSVSSNNLKDILGGSPKAASPSPSDAVEAALMAFNPHIKHLDFDNHGFSVLDVTPARTQMDWYVISDRADPDAAVTHATSWRTLTGTGLVQLAEGPVA